jgi:exonuclease SbcD
MRILHTADWHLGDRLGRIDRTRDLQKAVERVAQICADYEVDTLLVAGDLFSERSRLDGLRESIEHLGTTFQPFLQRGGTIIAITGNHDSESLCRMLRHTMELAAPPRTDSDPTCPSGRFYLADTPALIAVTDPCGTRVQFALMPYPSPGRYLKTDGARYENVEERNRELREAFRRALRALQSKPNFDPNLPSVLMAHAHLEGVVLSHAFRMTADESVLLAPHELSGRWSYVALGHIHKAQCVAGQSHIRYAGSLERLDVGESGDEKSVVFTEVGADGCCTEPVTIPLAARPVLDIRVIRPREEIPVLRALHPGREEALVRYHVTYEPGRDVLNDLLKDLDEVFPYWYERSWSEAGAGDALAPAAPPRAGRSIRDTILEYLESQIRDACEREEMLSLMEGLLQEEGVATSSRG